MKQLTKTDQIKFYQEEIKKILNDYKAYLDSKCIDLISKGELYIGIFEYVDNLRNQVVFSFPKSQIPNTRIPLTASIPKTQETLITEFKAITYNTYRNKFVKAYSECTGIYYQESEGIFKVGFNNFDLEFLNSLSKGDKIVFGISDPPLKYYFNLIQITKNDANSTKAEEVISGEYQLNDFKPVHIDDSLELIAKYKTDLKNHETIIIQGPPGTGKTYFISRLLELLSKENKSVLVATLANRSLIELAKKYFEIEAANMSVVYKSNLTLEESKEAKALKPMPKDFLPAAGGILLTTFYKMTGIAVGNISSPVYDYIILEEASQCFLGTIAAAKLLGKKVILVGDPLQLPPVVNQDNPVNISPNIDLMLESFTFYASTINCPKFRLTTTYRFSDNACAQTNTFYENSLKSKSDIQKDNNTFSKISNLYNKEGGCSLFHYDSTNLRAIYDLLLSQINALLQINPKFEIAILSSTKKGVKLLRDNLLYKMNDKQDQILINTVDGVQGLTVDFCFYFAFSDNSPAFSFKLNRFNVATSRARFCTLILLDEVYKVVQPYKGMVAEFISKCDLSNDASFPNIIEESKNNDSIPVKTSGLKVIDKIDLSKFEKPKKEIVKDKENIYIIDTNVFVNQPDIISKIDEKYKVVLSAKVIDELDSLKIRLNEEEKRNVQRALKYINDSLDTPHVKMEIANSDLLPADFNRKSPDNMILSVALKFKDDNPIMLTSDNGLQIKAKGLGVTTISLKDFLNQRKY
jgi:rRNA-processing protein FCF1/GTPase SAR1 family protein